MLNLGQGRENDNINQLLSINSQQFQLLALEKDETPSLNPEVSVLSRQPLIQASRQSKGVDLMQTTAKGKIINQQEVSPQSNMAQKCARCADMQIAIFRLKNDKQEVSNELVKVYQQLQRIKRQQNKEITKVNAGKEQLNFYVESLKQMIKCFEQQNERLKNWMVKTLRINLKDEKHRNNINIRQVIQNSFTDLIVNDQELGGYISQILVLSDVKKKDSQYLNQDEWYSGTDPNIFNRFYSSRRKLQKIKDNILKMRKQMQKLP